MNSKQVKKIRKIIKKEQVGSFQEFADTINTAPLKLRVKIAFKILIKKL